MAIIHNSDGSYTLTTPITAADLDALSAGQGATTPPPPTQSSGFRGIFAFNTSNASTFASNPNVAGSVLMRYWAEVNSQQGVYNWDLMDADMKPWIDAGKEVIWRISTSGWASWQKAQNSGRGTPKWVFDQGVPFVTDDDGSIKPQYWNLTFLKNLETFVQAMAARYDGNKSILAFEIGVGDGGETKPDTEHNSDVLSKWQAIGYSDANWYGAIQAIISMYVQAFKETPLVLMPDASFLKGDPGFDEAKVVNYAAQFGIWMQWNGLVAGAKLPGSFSGLKKGYPLLLEQLNAAGQNNRKLADDLSTAMGFSGVQAMLVFTSDLQDPKNADTLARVAGK